MLSDMHAAGASCTFHESASFISQSSAAPEWHVFCGRCLADGAPCQSLISGIRRRMTQTSHQRSSWWRELCLITHHQVRSSTQSRMLAGLCSINSAWGSDWERQVLLGHTDREQTSMTTWPHFWKLLDLSRVFLLELWSKSQVHGDMHTYQRPPKHMSLKYCWRSCDLTFHESYSLHLLHVHDCAVLHSCSMQGHSEVSGPTCAIFASIFVSLLARHLSHVWISWNSVFCVSVLNWFQLLRFSPMDSKTPTHTV